MGIYDSDPSLNTKIHDVEFPDGLVRKYGVMRLKQVLDQCRRREGNAVSKEKNLVMRKWSMEATTAYCAMEETNSVEIAESMLVLERSKIRWHSSGVSYASRKKSSIIAAVKSRAKRKIHKYGIEVPQSMMLHAARIKRVKQHDVARRSIHYHLRSTRLV
eukprot:scaffold6974_cov109-Skeletonema_dohrnii-CCMP3373.AAC.3